MRIYLDVCCFNRPFDDQSELKVKLETDAKLSIQEHVLDNAYELVWSYVIDYENRRNPFPAKRNSISGWKQLAVATVVESESILELADTLSSKGIKTMDALHIACSVYSKCDYFITTDKKLINSSVEGIRILSPIRFIEEEG
jgi:predicted nucleic acid-binding protein